ncbi:MAG: winged helix-turn-helix transcriptional regulator [Candidatus Nitrosocosmicus sp.]
MDESKLDVDFVIWDFLDMILKDGNENTYRIINHIKENPGCYLRQIKKSLHLSMGSIQYHLNKLEFEGKIISQKSGLYKHYFPIDVFKEHEKDIMTFLTQETSREIIMFIAEKSSPTQTDIAKKLRIAPASINWHLKRLLNANIIREIKDGKYKRYILSPDTSSLNVGKLLKNYYPSTWDKWSNRLAEMFLSLSSVEEKKREG